MLEDINLEANGFEIREITVTEAFGMLYTQSVEELSMKCSGSPVSYIHEGGNLFYRVFWFPDDEDTDAVYDDRQRSRSASPWSPQRRNNAMSIRYRTSELIPGANEWKHTWHATKGKFVGWDTGGVFNFIYACIKHRRRSVLFIPIHNLHPEDRARDNLRTPNQKGNHMTILTCPECNREVSALYHVAGHPGEYCVQCKPAAAPQFDPFVEDVNGMVIGPVLLLRILDNRQPEPDRQVRPGERHRGSQVVPR